jgi:hypothetical protein
MMPTTLDELLRWCRTERENLKQHIDLMERGVVFVGELHLNSARRDITAEAIVIAKRKIAELDALLAKYPAK